MQKQLSKIIDALERAMVRLEALAEATPAVRWSTRNDPSRWSVAECVAKNVVVTEFKRLQDELTGLIREGDGLALDKVLIASPFAGSVRYDCYSALVLLQSHQERHLQQAGNVWSA